MVLSTIDLNGLLDSARTAAYRWNIQTDTISWYGDVAGVLHVRDPEIISTGKGYLSLLDESQNRAPHGEILNKRHVQSFDIGKGFPYENIYAICPLGRNDTERVWIEDIGQWFAGHGGKPSFAQGIIRPVSERLQREQHLTYLSRTDCLTGQFNRWALNELLETTIKQSISAQFSAAFLIVAIDNLGLINEAYGFDIADQIVRDLSIHLRNKLRGGDIIGRYSGNKFGIILSSCHRDGIAPIVERLMQSAREVPTSNGYSMVTNTISVGGVLIPEHAKDAATAMTNAQIALNEAKKSFRETFVIYDGRNSQESHRKQNILAMDTATSALNEGRVTYALQPIVDAKTEQPAFHECLLRIKQPDNSILGPGNFIKQAEELGFIRLLDYRILELALVALAQNTDLHIAINISLDTTCEYAWLDILKTQAIKNPDLAHRMTIEITETRIISDPKEINDKLIKILRDIGYKIAIDDFGAGYTSFSNLRLLDVDMVKIDGSFIKNLSKETHNQKFVRMLIDLAQSLNIKTVAEWVETREDANLLKEWGIDYMQGFLFGTPKIDNIKDHCSLKTPVPLNHASQY